MCAENGFDYTHMSMIRSSVDTVLEFPRLALLFRQPGSNRRVMIAPWMLWLIRRIVEVCSPQRRSVVLSIGKLHKCAGFVDKLDS